MNIIVLLCVQWLGRIKKTVSGVFMPMIAVRQEVTGGSSDVADRVDLLMCSSYTAADIQLFNIAQPYNQMTEETDGGLNDC